jgi:hypothetical protein
MRRGLLSILLVALISLMISHGSRAWGEREAPRRWIRTADGWEPAESLTKPDFAAAPSLHPAIVAGGQLLFSTLCLVAFPRTAPRRSGTGRSWSAANS